VDAKGTEKVEIWIKNFVFVEIRALPALAHCFPRSFTFYVAHPIRSIRVA
jgi:hypothetical protein